MVVDFHTVWQRLRHLPLPQPYWRLGEPGADRSAACARTRHFAGKSRPGYLDLSLAEPLLAGGAVLDLHEPADYLHGLPAATAPAGAWHRGGTALVLARTGAVDAVAPVPGGLISVELLSGRLVDERGSVVDTGTPVATTAPLRLTVASATAVWTRTEWLRPSPQDEALAVLRGRLDQAEPAELAAWHRADPVRNAEAVLRDLVDALSGHDAAPTGP